MASARDEDEDEHQKEWISKINKNKNWSAAEWDKHMPSFKVGDKHKVDDVLYERERDAVEALITTLVSDVPAREVMQTVPLTTQHYIDYCYPEPKGTSHQQSECTNQTILNEININRVLEHIFYDDRTRTIRGLPKIKLEIITPLIKAFIRYKNTFNDEESIRLMFTQLEHFYGIRGRDQNGTWMIDKDTVKIALKYNNVKAMSQIIGLPLFFAELNVIKLQMIENGEMQPLIEELVHNKHYEMLQTIFGSPGWGINVPSWLDPSILTPQQTKKLLTIPLEITLPWDDNSIKITTNIIKNSIAVSSSLEIFSFVVSLAGYEQRINWTYSTENLLSQWEDFIKYMFDRWNEGQGQWNIKKDLAIQMIEDNELTDDVIRILWFILIWMCNEENKELDLMDPDDDDPFVERDVCKKIADIFIAILKRIENNTDSSDLKKDKAFFFLKVWTLYPNIKKYIANVPESGQTLYNLLVGEGQFITM